MSEQNVSQTPPNHEIAGTLEPEEKGVLNGLQEQANNVVRQIGELEVRKARLLGALSDLEGRSSGIMQNVAKRLNIPEGRRWHVSGEAVFVESAAPSEAPPAE